MSHTKSSQSKERIIPGFFHNLEFRDALALLTLLVAVATSIFSYYNNDKIKLQFEDEKLKNDDARLEIENIKLSIDRSRVGIERSKLNLDESRTSIEQWKLRLDMSKSSIDLSKFLGDLKPKLTTKCDAYFVSRTRLHVSCESTNTGSHSLVYDVLQSKLFMKHTNAMLPSTMFKQISSNGNFIPAGLTGGNTVVLDVASSVDWINVEIKTEIHARTDENIIEIAKQMLKESTDENRINVISNQLYTIPASIALPAE